MLSLHYISFFFKKNIKNGLFVDYILRLIAKTNLQNLFIWAGLYVGEKFLIEYLTRFSTNSNSTKFLNSHNPLYVFNTSCVWILILSLIFSI